MVVIYYTLHTFILNTVVYVFGLREETFRAPGVKHTHTIPPGDVTQDLVAVRRHQDTHLCNHDVITEHRMFIITRNVLD